MAEWTEEEMMQYMDGEHRDSMPDKALSNFFKVLKELRAKKVLFDGLDIYAGIDLECAKQAVLEVTEGKFIVRVGSDELDYLGRDSTHHVTIIRADENKAESAT